MGMGMGMGTEVHKFCYGLLLFLSRAGLYRNQVAWIPVRKFLGENLRYVQYEEAIHRCLQDWLLTVGFGWRGGWWSDKIGRFKW